MSKDSARQEGPADTEDSFSSMVKACPSCFAMLVPTTKQYKQSFWAQTNRYRWKPGAIHRAKNDIKQNWPFCFVPSFCFKFRSHCQCRKHNGNGSGWYQLSFSQSAALYLLYKQLHTMSCSLPNWPLDVLSGGRRPAPTLRLMSLPVGDMPASNIFCKDPCSSLTTETSSHLCLDPSIWQSATCNSQEILKDVCWIERCFPRL